MALVRLAGQGRLAEWLDSSPRGVNVDTFMRRMGFAYYATQEVHSLDKETRDWLQAYVDGVNEYVQSHHRPLEFLLAGYRPEPWTLADCIATLKIMSYIGLAEGQQDAEKWIIQALKRGTRPEVLKRLFQPYLDGLDRTILDAIKKLKVEEPLVPEEVRSYTGLPRLRGSNNWAMSGALTVSGFPLQGNDPHLEGNRLPAVWYEFVAEVGDDYRLGVSMPGFPGMVMGRNSKVSAGFTYGFMDMVDYFIEDCEGGAFLSGSQRIPFQTRVETIKRRNADPLVIQIHENQHGRLEGNPHEQGFYLCLAWSAYRSGAAQTFDALRRFQTVGTVPDAQKVLRNVAISCNWLIADSSGNLGYQQSGLLPRRRHSGLYPVLGWLPESEWGGEVDPAELESILNPQNGFLVTANDHWQARGRPTGMNLHMGDYRAERIRRIIGSEKDWSTDSARRIQSDVYSVQAERFMTLIRPQLPGTKEGEALRNWDLRYQVESKEALWFEAIYSRLLTETFGALLGADVWRYTAKETAILVDYHWFFDKAFLGEDRNWFLEESREKLIKRIVGEVLQSVPHGTWGDSNRFVMKNMFFEGRLPRWLGFDRGPIPIPGCRATPSQGQVFRNHAKATSFLPTWRYITDMAESHAWTALAGGPSGRRLTRWYANDIDRWKNNQYKCLAVQPLRSTPE